jgi:hypothetical protein
MAIAMTDKTAGNSKEAFEMLRKVLTQIEWASDPDEESASFYIDFGPPIPFQMPWLPLQQRQSSFFFT